MGYYIQTGQQLTGKAKYIIDNHGGRIIPQPQAFHSVANDKAIICVVGNGDFDAAAYCFNEAEFEEFAGDNSGRPKAWILIDKNLADKLTGYNRK